MPTVRQPHSFQYPHAARNAGVQLRAECNRKMNRVIFNVFKDEDKEYYESELQRNA